MANNEQLLKGHPPTEFKAGQEQAKTARKAGIASGKSKRHQKKLAKRIALALTISTTANLNIIKKEIAELMPNRHLKANKEDLKLKLAQAKTLKECGIDVYNMIKIAVTSFDEDKRIKAINSLWDREEGKPLAKTENKEVQEFSDEIEYLD